MTFLERKLLSRAFVCPYSTSFGDVIRIVLVFKDVFHLFILWQPCFRVNFNSPKLVIFSLQKTFELFERELEIDPTKTVA